MKTIRRFIFLFGYLSLSLLFLTTIANAERITGLTDIDGDELGDLILFDGASPSFVYRKSSDSQFVSTNPTSSSIGDLPVVGDFNGDGNADIGTYNRSTATFHLSVNPFLGATTQKQVGSTGDVPVPGKYTGGSCSELATYNPTSGRWTLADCNGENATTVTFGGPGLVPVPGDYDCDGKDDLATYDRRFGEWRIRQSSNNNAVDTFFFGLPGDIPLPADYDEDNCDEGGVFRPSSALFFSVASYQSGEVAVPNTPVQWGLPGDTPALVNIDGDNVPDYAVFRPNLLSYFIKTSTGSVFRVDFSGATQSATRLADSRATRVSLVNVPFPVSRHNTIAKMLRVRGDYTGDGRADLGTASVDRTRAQTTFNIRHSTGADSTFTLNLAGDAIVPGDFNGDGKTEGAVVFVDTDTADLLWLIQGASGSFIFGQNQDQPVTGDFDCDGKTDKALAREVDGFKRWFFRLSATDDGSTSVSDYLFGLAGDKVYSADINGDGCDEIVVSRVFAGGVYWFYRNIAENVDHVVQWGLDGDDVQTPSDLNGDGLADFLIVREISGGKFAFQRIRETFFFATGFGLSGDDFLTGAFSGIGRNQLAVFRRGASNSTTSNFFVRDQIGGAKQFQFGRRNQVLLRPDGTVVQPPDGSGGGSDDGGDSGGNDDPPPPPDNSPGCTASPGTDTDFSDGRGNSLWKPHSEGVPNEAPAILLPRSPYCSLFKSGRLSLRVLGRDGNEVSSIQKKHCRGPNGGRVHYWPSKTASQLRAFAPLTVKIQYNGTTECRRVPNPGSRYD